MINRIPGRKKTQIAKIPKIHVARDMRATRHEMHKSILDMKHLEYDESEAQVHIRHEAREARE